MAAALPENQPRVTDLIPRRRSVLALWFLVALTCLVGIEALYTLRAAWPEQRQFPQAFELRGYGTLIAGFQSAILAVAGAVGAVIYALRQHRLDDYRARYRIWPWAIAACFVLAMDQVAPVIAAARALAHHWTNWGALAGSSLAWAAGVTSIFVVVASLAAWDMRRDKPALGVLLAGVLLASIAWWINRTEPATAQLLTMGSAASALACLALLFCLVLYARSILVEIDMGPVEAAMSVASADAPAKADAHVKMVRSTTVDAKRTKSKPTDKAVAEQPPRRVAREEPASSKSVAPLNQQSSPEETGTRVAETPAPESKRRMTKAERKALRRQEKLERRETQGLGRRG